MAVMSSDVTKHSLKQQLNENISPKLQYKNMRVQSFILRRNKNKVSQINTITKKKQMYTSSIKVFILVSILCQ
jgi:hypothetical protein